MLDRVKQVTRGVYDYLKLSPAARAERRKDLFGLPLRDCSIERAIDEAAAWLCLAHDQSLSQDGGVAHHYSLINGWSASYPETTGYIIPTMLAYANLRHDETVRQRVKRMLDWLLLIQLPDGGFQDGMIDSESFVPVAFDTGQILIGLASGVHEFGPGYRKPMCLAADWLVHAQDMDGAWRKYPSRFAAQGEKAYQTHIAWGLLEAALIEPDKPYAEAGLANVYWALQLQQDNGWFSKCCLSDESRPLTHTLGYVLRGIIEAYRYTKKAVLLNACKLTAEGLLLAIREDGFLPGRLFADWRAAVSWCCLTGSAQIAICYFLLYHETGDPRYRNAAYLLNQYLRRTVEVEADAPPETRGAIKGSFPVFGAYGSYKYLNWACKFFLDSQMLEQELRKMDDDSLPHNAVRPA